MLLSTAKSAARTGGLHRVLQGFSPRPLSSTGFRLADSADDFAPKYASSAVDVTQQIEADIQGSKVFVYMKGDPEAPMCGFSNMVCKVLTAYGVDFQSRDVLSDPDIREGVKKYSQWPTIPQVYIDGEFVGGSDILMGLHQSGELEKLLKEQGVKQ